MTDGDHYEKQRNISRYSEIVIGLFLPAGETVLDPYLGVMCIQYSTAIAVLGNGRCCNWLNDIQRFSTFLSVEFPKHGWLLQALIVQSVAFLLSIIKFGQQVSKIENCCSEDDYKDSNDQLSIDGDYGNYMESAYMGQKCVVRKSLSLYFL